MAAAPPTPAVTLELLLTIKELQLQYGLRTDDYERYHSYCSGRIHSLRKQLKLSVPEPKAAVGHKRHKEAATTAIKFVPPKKVTPEGVKDGRHILLAALLVERCWAEAEEMRAQHIAARQKGDTGNGWLNHARKRLNKAAHNAAELSTIVEGSAADAKLKLEGAAYVAEIRSRCALIHDRFADADAELRRAREALTSLHRAHASATNPSYAALLHGKAVECDDRIAYCLQQQGKDPAAYKPVALTAVGGAEAGLSAVPWLGRQLNVTSIRLKEALREANATGAAAALSRFVTLYEREAGGKPAASKVSAETPSGASARSIFDDVTLPTPFVTVEGGMNDALWFVFQQQSAINKITDGFDRTIARLNDAIDIHKQETKDGLAGDRTTANLLTHALNYQLHLNNVRRTSLIALSVAARFAASREYIAANSGAATGTDRGYRYRSATSADGTGKKEQVFYAQHLASPLDAARLYEMAVQKAQEMLLLPGVEGNPQYGDHVESAAAHFRCDRLYFVAHSWLSAASTAGEDNTAKASDAFLASIEASNGGVSEAALSARGRAALIAIVAQAQFSTADITSASLTVELVTSTAGATTSAGLARTVTYAADQPNHFEPCSGFARFPPDFQSMPCKPTFVDVAGTYVGLPTRSGGAPQPPASAAAAPSSSTKSGAAPTAVASTPAAATAAPSAGKEDAPAAKGGWLSGWGWGGKKK